MVWVSSIYKKKPNVKEYDGYNFDVGTLKIKYRKAKITPKKLDNL